jgi:hypothetical protein
MIKNLGLPREQGAKCPEMRGDSRLDSHESAEGRPVRTHTLGARSGDDEYIHLAEGGMGKAITALGKARTVIPAEPQGRGLRRRAASVGDLDKFQPGCSTGRPYIKMIAAHALEGSTGPAFPPDVGPLSARNQASRGSYRESRRGQDNVADKIAALHCSTACLPTIALLGKAKSRCRRYSCIPSHLNTS